MEFGGSCTSRRLARILGVTQGVRACKERCGAAGCVPEKWGGHRFWGGVGEGDSAGSPQLCPRYKGPSGSAPQPQPRGRKRGALPSSGSTTCARAPAGRGSVGGRAHIAARRLSQALSLFSITAARRAERRMPTTRRSTTCPRPREVPRATPAARKPWMAEAAWRPSAASPAARHAGWRRRVTAPPARPTARPSTYGRLTWCPTGAEASDSPLPPRITRREDPQRSNWQRPRVMR